jgi:hypothetical protein
VVPLRDFPTPVGSDEPFQAKSLFIASPPDTVIFFISGSTLTSLINAFGCNSAMILFGLLQEQSALRRGTQSLADWAPFIFGSIVGIVPWISLSLQLGLSQTDCLNHANATVFTTYPTTAPALSNASTPRPPLPHAFLALSLAFTRRCWCSSSPLPSTCCCNICACGAGASHSSASAFYCGCR